MSSSLARPKNSGTSLCSLLCSSSVMLVTSILSRGFASYFRKLSLGFLLPMISIGSNTFTLTSFTVSLLRGSYILGGGGNLGAGSSSFYLGYSSTFTS